MIDLFIGWIVDLFNLGYEGQPGNQSNGGGNNGGGGNTGYEGQPGNQSHHR